MTTCWSQEEHDASTQAEQEAGQNVRIPPEPLAPVPDAHIDPPSANRVEEQALLTAGHTRWRVSFIGWGVMVVAMVLGTVVLFILDAVSLGVLVAAMAVAGIVAVVGFGHYLLRGGCSRGDGSGSGCDFKMMPVDQEPANQSRPANSTLGVNDRERRDLLQPPEHSIWSDD